MEFRRAMIDGPEAHSTAVIERSPAGVTPGGYVLSRLPVLFRRRWYVLAPLFAIGLSSFVVAELLPYVSEALIVVEEQKVPEQYVSSNVKRNAQARLDTITQRVLSRTRLQNVIKRLHLCCANGERASINAAIDRVRDNVAVEPVQGKSRNSHDGLTAFRIRYSSRRAAVAQKVANELASLFVEESARTRAEQSLRTTEFLDKELLRAQKALELNESKLRDYKTRFIAALPEQRQFKLHALQSLETQLQTTLSARDRAEQQQVYVETVLRERESRNAAIRDGSHRPASPERADAEAQLARLRTQYVDAQTRYTDNHPDIAALRGRIAAVQSRLVTLEEQDGIGYSRAPATAPVAGGHGGDPQSRLDAVNAEIAFRTREESLIRARIRDMQAVLDTTPVRELELAAIVRACENSKEHYQSLLQKKMQSELASKLEMHQQGEQFRLIDPATLPTRRRGQNLVVWGGWTVGVLSGLALLYARTAVDQTVHDRLDVVSDTSLPVLVSIPIIPTRAETVAKRWTRAAEVGALTVLVTISAFGTVRYCLTA